MVADMVENILLVLFLSYSIQWVNAKRAPMLYDVQRTRDKMMIVKLVSCGNWCYTLYNVENTLYFSKGENESDRYF